MVTRTKFVTARMCPGPVAEAAGPQFYSEFLMQKMFFLDDGSFRTGYAIACGAPTLGIVISLILLVW